MKQQSRIPIKNLYYLLCYAWDKLEMKGLVNVFTDGQHDATNLLARILVTSASFVVRRGIDRSYVRRSELLRTVRGRFDAASTIARNGVFTGRACCEYDEFDPDVLHNRIMKAMLRRLVRAREVAAANRNEAVKLLHKLNEVSEVDLSASIFRRVHLHRNNAFYAVVLSTCELLYHNLLPSSDGSGFTIHEFGGAPQEMGALFQRFVANFYRRNQKVYAIKPQYLEWREFTGDPDALLGLLGGDHNLRSGRCGHRFPSSSNDPSFEPAR